MVKQDRMRQLDVVVDELLGRHEFGSFSQYWALYKRTVIPQEAEASYLVCDPDTKWCNVAIIDNNKIIDIEGEDGSDVGSISVREVSHLSAVLFKLGPVTGYRRSQGASLVVATELIGSTSGSFWIARTRDEEEQLVQFTRFLIGLVPNSRVQELE